MWTSIVDWFQSKGGFAHVIFVVYLALLGAYGAVPAVKTLFTTIDATFPTWLNLIVMAVLGFVAWYTPTASASAVKSQAKANAAGK